MQTIVCVQVLKGQYTHISTYAYMFAVVSVVSNARPASTHKRPLLLTSASTITAINAAVTAE
jgi:hypothetical protein